MVNENHPVFQPRGQASTDHSHRQRTQEIEAVKGLEENVEQQPPGFNCGEVALNGKKYQPMQPCEKEQAMQKPGSAECSSFSVLMNEVDVNTMQNPCMASCSAMQKSPLTNTMQHEQDIYTTPPFEPNSQDTNLNDGSLIGPSFKLTHTNGSRPSNHSNTSRHPIHLNHTPHEQPSPSFPSLRAGDGEPRKALERIFPRTYSRRDSELCPCKVEFNQPCVGFIP